MHGKQMAVPDGTPCWHQSNPWDLRQGMCFQGACTLPAALAVSPVCGNGGIDYNEQCDCGDTSITTDPCCDCATCKLKDQSMQCAANEACCDPTTCQFRPNTHVCRPAVDSQCDLAETCTGQSSVCPADVGKQAGTACTYAEDGKSSTCYAKKCVMSKDKQCETVTAQRATVYPLRDVIGAASGTEDSDSSCAALMCCRQYETVSGGVTTLHTSCSKLTSSESFTINGETTTIYLGGTLTGTQIVNGKSNEDSSVVVAGTRLCIRQQYYEPKTSALGCSAGNYFEPSIADCVKCDASCVACSGPSQFDCTGNCIGNAPRDSRGACPPFDVSSGTSSTNSGIVNVTGTSGAGGAGNENATTTTTPTSGGGTTSGGSGQSSGSGSVTTTTTAAAAPTGAYKQKISCVMSVPTGSTSTSLMANAGFMAALRDGLARMYGLASITADDIGVQGITVLGGGGGSGTNSTGSSSLLMQLRGLNELTHAERHVYQWAEEDPAWSVEGAAANIRAGEKAATSSQKSQLLRKLAVEVRGSRRHEEGAQALAHPAMEAVDGAAVSSRGTTVLGLQSFSPTTAGSAATDSEKDEKILRMVYHGEHNTNNDDQYQELRLLSSSAASLDIDYSVTAASSSEAAQVQLLASTSGAALSSTFQSSMTAAFLAAGLSSTFAPVSASAVSTTEQPVNPSGSFGPNTSSGSYEGGKSAAASWMMILMMMLAQLQC